jgi:hypothetical protein
MKRYAPDVVFHAAGSASVGASMSDPVSDYNASVGTWAALLEGIRQSALKPRIFFPSSAAVYGNPATLPVSEDAALAPISPYGHNKVIATIKDGGFFGEIGILLSQPRTATIRAKTLCDLFVLEKTDFSRMAALMSPETFTLPVMNAIVGFRSPAISESKSSSESLMVQSAGASDVETVAPSMTMTPSLPVSNFTERSNPLLATRDLIFSAIS